MSNVKIVVSTGGITSADTTAIINTLQVMAAHGVTADFYWLVGVGTLETVVRAVLEEVRR